MKFFSGHYLRKLFPKAYFTLPPQYGQKVEEFVFWKLPGRKGLVLKHKDKSMLVFSPDANVWRQAR